MIIVLDISVAQESMNDDSVYEDSVHEYSLYEYSMYEDSTYEDSVDDDWVCKDLTYRQMNTTEPYMILLQILYALIRHSPFPNFFAIIFVFLFADNFSSELGSAHNFHLSADSRIATPILQ